MCHAGMNRNILLYRIESLLLQNEIANIPVHYCQVQLFGCLIQKQPLQFCTALCKVVTTFGREVQEESDGRRRKILFVQLSS